MVIHKVIPKKFVSRKLTLKRTFIRKKKYLDPYIKFKGVESRKILDSLKKNVDFVDMLKFTTRKLLINIKKQFESKNINFLKNKKIQSQTHILLPLAGMGELGFFIKPFFAELFPYARVDFITTPKSLVYDNRHVSDKIKNKNMLENLNKIISKKDDIFIMIDTVSFHETFELLKSNILSIKKSEVLELEVLMEHFTKLLEPSLSKYPLFHKKNDGSYSEPFYLSLKGKERAFEKNKFEVVSYFLSYSGQNFYKVFKEKYFKNIFN